MCEVRCRIAGVFLCIRLECKYLCHCDMKREKDIVNHRRGGLDSESRGILFLLNNTIIDTATTRIDNRIGRFFYILTI